MARSTSVAIGSGLGLLLATSVLADPPRQLPPGYGFIPGTIVVSRIHYVDDPSRPGETYPEIFNDPAVSGVQGTIFLDSYTTDPFTPALRSLPLTQLSLVPQPEITTSFSSKSEGSLHLSLDGQYLTYMGYVGPAGAEGVSNSETTDPNAQVTGATAPFYDRGVAIVKYDGTFTVIDENFAYSGDNPRGAITVDGKELYMGGNADSTENKTPAGTGPGFTIGVRYGLPQQPAGLAIANSSLLANYTATDRPDESAKKHVKDNNWRGIGIFNDANGNPALFVSKGSGGNGDDGIFQVNNTSGTGLPTPSTTNTVTQMIGDQATNPQTGASSPLVPFGFFFANPTTVYVADEGNATIPVLDSSGNPVLDSNGQPEVQFVSDPLAGLQKWVLVGGVWQLEYVLQDGLDLNIPENVKGYPVPTRTTGLRNLAGQVNRDGTVTLYAVTAQTSEISGGEPDPTKLVMVTDLLDATMLPQQQPRGDFFDGRDRDQSLEHFVTLQQSAAGDVFRGVALAPQAAGH
jgi:hypothetical protein